MGKGQPCVFLSPGFFFVGRGCPIVFGNLSSQQSPLTNQEYACWDLSFDRSVFTRIDIWMVIELVRRHSRGEFWRLMISIVFCIQLAYWTELSIIESLFEENTLHTIIMRTKC